MFVYLFLLIVSQFLSFISVRSKQFKNIFWTPPLTIFYITIVIIVGFRDNVGVDFNGYRQNFNQNISYKYELGFRVVSDYFYNFGFEDWTIFFFAAAITWYYILKSFKVFPKILPWGLFFIFTGGWFFSSLNGIRQIIAVSIFVYAFKYIQEKKLLKYLVYLLFASLFHKSVLLMIPIYFFIEKLNFKSFFWIILYLISYPLSSFVNSLDFIQNIFEYGNIIFSVYETTNDYTLESLEKTYDGVYNSGLGFFLNFLITATILFFSQKLVKDKPEYSSYFNMYYIWALIFMYTWQLSIFNRILMYFIIFGVFCFALVVTEYKNNPKWKIPILALIFVLFLYYILITFSLNYSFI
jgi:hypothetical protein